MSEVLRSLFAARLVQARQMRGLSQRALGDRMGLGKEKGSSRINRYEHQVTAVGFESLDTLAQVLEVPPAYLLADNQEMAQTILLFSNIAPEKQASAVQLLQLLQQHPDLIEKLHALVPGLVTKP